MLGNRGNGRPAAATDAGPATAADAAMTGIGRSHRLLIGRAQLRRLRGAIRLCRSGLMMGRSAEVVSMDMQSVRMPRMSLGGKRHELNDDQRDRRRHYSHELRCQHHADALPPVRPDG